LTLLRVLIKVYRYKNSCFRICWQDFMGLAYSH